MMSMRASESSSLSINADSRPFSDPALRSFLFASISEARLLFMAVAIASKALFLSLVEALEISLEATRA